MSQQHFAISEALVYKQSHFSSQEETRYQGMTPTHSTSCREDSQKCCCRAELCTAHAHTQKR